jgi:hypothetical protein
MAATVNSRENRIGMEVYIGHENSKSMFKQLQTHQAAVEEALKVKLQWNELPDGHACRILNVRKDSPFEDEGQWPVYFAWLEDAALRMSAVFRPLVKALSRRCARPMNQLPTRLWRRTDRTCFALASLTRVSRVCCADATRSERRSSPHAIHRVCRQARFTT